MENEKDMGTVVSDYAIENFKNGLNCAESVMDALVRSGALKDSPEIVGLCTGFGGGIGLAGYTCGALSAAVWRLPLQGAPDRLPQNDRRHRQAGL